MDYPANCRVLVLSASPDLSGSLIRRIAGTETVPDGLFAEWVISNKYYTAPVHFHRPTWTGTTNMFEKGTPAVLYVFNGKENYRSNLQIIGQHLKPFDLDVMLAVSLPRENEEESYLDLEELEELCASHGFEYVEGVIDSTPGQGVHRIVEALHTIMWPSMQQQPLRSPKRKAPPKPNIVPKPSLEDPDSLENIEWTQFPTDEFRAEKIALETWLDSDDSVPIIAPDKSPTSTLIPDPTSNGPSHTPAGFEDDFSDFVSAPASAFERLADEEGAETGRSQDHKDAEDDDVFSDDFFPTDQEILTTSHRIFGPLLPSQRASSSLSEWADGEGKSDKDEGEGEDGGDTLRDVDFDLSKIMGVLQGLKEEISGIENEEAKRRMAARVAMGLLYGLEG